MSDDAKSKANILPFKLKPRGPNEPPGEPDVDLLDDLVAYTVEQHLSTLNTTQDLLGIVKTLVRRLEARGVTVNCQAPEGRSVDEHTQYQLDRVQEARDAMDMVLQIAEVAVSPPPDAEERLAAIMRRRRDYWG